MALTEDQLALITEMERPDDRPENEYPRGTGTVSGTIAACQFDGLGVPSYEDVEAALQKLRGVTPAESRARRAAIREANLKAGGRQTIPLPAGVKARIAAVREANRRGGSQTSSPPTAE